MSLELDYDGPLAPRDSARTRALRTAGRAEEPWPLLAQLPRIDAPHPASEPLPLFTPPAPLGDRDLLALIDLPDDAPPQAPQRYAGDPSLAPTLSPGGPAGPGPGLGTALRADGAAAARHYRVDQASLHRAAVRTANERKPPTLAGSLFQMHAALAPHLGLVGAVGLVATASLLYWLAIGRHGTPVAAPAPRGDAAWTAEVATDADPPIIVAQPEQTAAAPPEPTADWSVPHIATATPTPMAAPTAGGGRMSDDGPTPTPSLETPARRAAAIDLLSPAHGAPAAADAAAALESEAAPPAPLGPSLAPPQDAAATTSAPAEFAARSGQAPPQQEITPTPQPEGFPTTSYPPFTFVDRPRDEQFPQQFQQQFGAGAPSQPSVAERTTTAPGLQ
ncbi:MAG TPA: hypothetical protein VEQ85_03080 [Lacipirellulaceae bacterium]|nr:hypothetical protein [Lacipirellulaceae bacterium]